MLHSSAVTLRLALQKGASASAVMQTSSSVVVVALVFEIIDNLDDNVKVNECSILYDFCMTEPVIRAV